MIFFLFIRKKPDRVIIYFVKKNKDHLKTKERKIRGIVKQATTMKIPIAGFTSALSYFDAYCSKQLPTNLIQAQRDYFGAHTYQRIDKEGMFHNAWQSLPEHAKKDEPEH